MLPLRIENDEPIFSRLQNRFTLYIPFCLFFSLSLFLLFCSMTLLNVYLKLTSAENSFWYKSKLQLHIFILLKTRLTQNGKKRVQWDGMRGKIQK